MRHPLSPDDHPPVHRERLTMESVLVTGIFAANLTAVIITVFGMVQR